MRLCTFRPSDGPPEGWPGRVDGGHIVQLDAPDLITVLARHGQVPTAARWRAADVQLLAPVPRPPSVRDFFAFEQHIATARANRGASVPAEWYEFPVFYFTNPAAIIGSGTVGTGCILEHNDGRWLQPGDLVEMEVEGIGILRNRVGPGERPGGGRGTT